MVKNLPDKVGDIRDAGSIPRSGRSPAEVTATHDLPGEIPWTEEPEAAVYRVTKSWT